MSECVGEGCAHESHGHAPRVLVVDDNATEDMKVALVASADTCGDGHSVEECRAAKNEVAVRAERSMGTGRRHHIHGAGRLRMVSPCANKRRQARRRHEKAQRRRNSR